jgi:cephalosporin-C deacetylase
MQHDFPFDPKYGYDLDALLKVDAPAGPDDFESFWRATYRQTRETPLKFASRPIDGPDHLDVFEVEFDSLDGVRIGGWMTVPRGKAVTRGVVVSHGYGERASYDPTVAGPTAAAIFPCARGLGRSRTPAIPPDVPSHVRHGIESRQTYVHRGCAADIWAAASALLGAMPGVASCLDYIGGSFGGGIGALALPWDDRFRRAFLDVPSFGQYPIRLKHPCVGSGESVRRCSLEHPEVIDVLKYFDAATAARFIRIPTLVAPALFDPAVHPPGQFAVYNAIPANKELFVRQTGHFDWPGGAEENERLQKRIDKWFAVS